MADVWIVIVGYRNADDIKTCFRAIETQTYRSWGVIVCENGGPSAFSHLIENLCEAPPSNMTSSPPEIRQVVGFQRTGHPCVLLEARDNLGYAGAINAGLAYLTSDTEWQFVWILNPDTEAHPDALSSLLQKATSKAYGIIGSRLVYRDTNLIQAYGGVWRKYTARGHSLGRSQPADADVDTPKIEQEMDYVLGASMLVSREYIDKIGPMDDRYFLYCEEVDWCMRRRDFKLGYSHDSIVFHVQGTTIGSKGSPKERAPLAIFLDERNRILMARRFYPTSYPIIVCIAGLCLARYLKTADWRSFFIAVRGWWAGLRNQAGRPSPQQKF